jgi:glyoxylase-like metal-dependent hydrolase (beta-lactamase superfamily II)
MQQIERGIYYEDNYLGVTLGGLVFSHGTILVDSPLRAEDARSWRSALLNQRGGANRLLVNLDSHPDRTLGDRALDCTIVAQQKTAQAFRNRPTIFKGQTIETGADWEQYTDAIGMRWATPDITFTQRMSLFWGGPEVILEHHPGPAPGATWVSIPDAKVVFVGDAVLPNQFPFLANADLPVWIDSLSVLQRDYQDFTIISGRGGPVASDDVRKQQQFLQTVHDDLDKLAQSNAPAEETEDLLPTLLAEMSVLTGKREHYTQRLLYGLFHYYNRRYRSATPPDQNPVEEEEE